MAATSHALLGPSSSHRWLNCTPSARLEEHVEDKGSDFAQEGSCAHALCEEKLWLLLGNEEQATAARAEQQACDYARWYTREMEEAAEDYAAAVWGKYQEALQTTPDAQLFIERRLTFDRWIYGSFGTADAIIIADGLMEVIDFKYGKGVEVSAVGNTQMRIYALGALAEFEDLYNIECIRMTIIQPRKANYSEDEISYADLNLWGESVLQPTAALADAGRGEQKPGDWCRFCKVKATCAKLATQALAAYTQHEDKALITPEQMPAILALLPAIKAWAEAVDAYATAQAISGQAYKGYKLVEGRSVRRITDAGELAARLICHGADEADIYRPAELRTLSDLERLMGKREFAALAEGLVEKPAGKPTLVPESDKRQPITVNTAVEDFKDININ